MHIQPAILVLAAIGIPLVAMTLVCWIAPRKPQQPRKSFTMIGQHDDGGREVIWVDYPSIRSAEQDFHQETDLVCAVIYDNANDQPIVTLVRDGQPLLGERWQRPELPPPGSWVEIDLDGSRTVHLPQKAPADV